MAALCRKTFPCYVSDQIRETMALVIRLVFAATLLGSLACSSPEDEPRQQESAPPYSGSLGNQPAMQNQPDSMQNTTPNPTPMASGGSGSEAQPNPVLMQPPSVQMQPPPEQMQTPVASGGAGGAPSVMGMAGAMNAGGAPANPPVQSPESDLPLFPGNAGQPRPSGTPTNLRVLNWAGFRAAISYTFDDTNASQIQHYQELNGLGVPFTFYLITAANHVQDLQSPVWPQALRDGHEIGNHTAGHLNSGGGNLAADTDTGEATLERMFGITVYTMAAPFGANDYVNIARSRYLINRGTPGGTIAPTGNTDPFNIPTFTPMENAQVGAFNTQVDNIINSGNWQTVLLHGFTNSANDGAFQPVAIGTFQQAVNYAKGKGNVWIDTVVAVGAYWLGQRAFSQATSTPNGDSRTLTWTLPDHFPPGKFLRVTVDGGTLTQGNTELTWNDRGFYEVALDARSLTFSP
jgi:peptidoglycan/xylan/chitin deacetylase (PgdA/CDA1 family)